MRLMKACLKRIDLNIACSTKVQQAFKKVFEIENVEVVTRDSSASEGVDKPVNPPVIKSLSVETYGIDYGIPKTQEPFDIQSWYQSHMTSN